MADYIIQGSTLDAIADAINAKTGGSSAMTPAEMVTEIGNIPTGSSGVSWVDIASYTAPSDVSEIVVSGDFGNYDVYEVTLNGQSSVAEWLYPIFSSTGSRGDYIRLPGGDGYTQFENIKMRICKTECGIGSIYATTLSHTGNDIAVKVGSVFDYLKIVPYNNTSLYKAGFNVTIRAANLSS